MKLIVPTITPIKNSHLDVQGLRDHLKFLEESHVDVFFILGTTGEFQNINLITKDKYVDLVCTLANIPVWVGVSSNTEKETLAMIEIANKSTAKAIVITPQLYENPTEVLEMCLEHCELPVYLYNNPHIQNNKNLPLDLIEEYSKQDKIVGIKDSSGQIGYFHQLLDMQSDTFEVIQGECDLIEESLELDVTGYVMGPANIAPNYFKSVLDTKDSQLIEKIPEIISDLVRRGEGNIIKGIKNGLVDMKLISEDSIFE